MRLTDKVAIITGGGKGIGKAIALAFAREGADVVVAGRTASALDDVVAEITGLGRRALAIPTDVAQDDQVRSMVETTASTFGNIDILVNNSGIAGPAGPVVDLNLDEFDEVMNINLRGALVCSQAVLKHMIPRKAGKIINITAYGGKRGYANRAPYALAKWALVGLTQVIAAEVGQYNIHVNDICPAPVAGERFDWVVKFQAEKRNISEEEFMKKITSEIPLRRITQPEEVAATAVFLACDESNSITGHSIDITGGMHMAI